jgi:L-alanine-DL-glutamate epimerase-like enolase superfamily enzyme
MLETAAESVREQVKITSIKAMTVGQRTWIKIETDRGFVGYGPGGPSGVIARDVIDNLHNGRLPHLGLIGKDPLAIQVHHHNMFYGFPQRGRQMKVLSGIDMALWDLAGKILNQPVSVLLGGNFRSREEWRDRAQKMKESRLGFKAFKIDIHHVLGMPMQQYAPSIGPRETRNVARAYELAREELGDDIDIIVHCHSELDVPTAIKVAQAVEPIKPLFYEDPIAAAYSEGWMALRRATHLPIMTGENLALAEQVLPFLQNQAVNHLQPDLINAGGITGTRTIAELAALYRIPVSLHNVGGLGLNMASQQWSAAVFNCPLMESRGDSDQAPEALSNTPVIKDGFMEVSTLPGLGIDLNQEYMKEARNEGEPWWGDD